MVRRAVLLLLATWPALAQSAVCRLQTVRLGPTGGRAGGWTVTLSQPDDFRRPTAWAGRFFIGRAGSATCEVSDQVSVLSAPIFLAGGRVLYAFTVDGSQGRVFAIDLADCAVRWTSRDNPPRPTLSGGRLRLAGGRMLTLGPDCLPASRD